MRHQLTAAIGLIVAATSIGAVAAPSAEDILRRIVERENQCLDGVESLLTTTSLMGNTVTEYSEKIPAGEVGGQPLYTLRPVPATELARRHSGGEPLAEASPEQLRDAASTIDEQAARAEQEVRSKMPGGVVGGIAQMAMSPPAGQPWLSANPRDVGNMYATMLNAAADAREEEAARDPAGEARDRHRDMQRIARLSRVVGEETVDGQQAYHIRAEDLNHVQREGPQTFKLHTVNLWVDSNRYVPLRFAAEGTLTDGDGTRDITIRRDDADYRSVDGCGCLLKPQRSVMKIEGMMTAEQKAEMRQAQAQLAQMKQQLASMPAGQRDMIMKRMAPQLEMMENMVEGGAFSLETRVLETDCNVPAPHPSQMLSRTFTGMSGVAPSTAARSSGPLAAPVDTGSQDDQRAAQMRCLEERAAAAAQAQKKKRGFGRLVGAVSRTASRLGDRTVGRVMSDVGHAQATAQDLNAAARDLGLTPEDAEACRNP